MTNEQAITALCDVALQWAKDGADGFSGYGQGYCGAMANILSTLGQCPAGKAAMGEARKGGKGRAGRARRGG